MSVTRAARICRHCGSAIRRSPYYGKTPRAWRYEGGWQHVDTKSVYCKDLSVNPAAQNAEPA